MAQISYGTITITDTTDIERIYPVYCKGGETNAPSLQPLTNWSENVNQAGGSGDYIWQRIVAKKQGIAVTADDYSDAVRLTGDDGASLTITSIQYAQTQNENDTPSYGNSMPSSINEGWWLWIKTTYSDGNSVVTKIKQGQKGDTGISVTGTKEIYFLKRTTDNIPTAPADGVTTTSTSTAGGIWTTVVPNYIEGGIYYTSIQTTYSGGTSPKSSTAVINQGLTDANAKALSAYNTSTARDTEVNALKAQAKHFWWDSEGAHIAAGQNTTSVDNITQGQPDTYTFNALTAPGFLKLRYKNIDFAQLATNSLTFYRPAVNDSTYVQGKKAMDLTADALTFYKPLAYNSSNEPTAAATLNANGLVLAEGGIKAGSSRTNNFIYLSSANFADIISGHTAGTVSLDNYTATDWRQLIGTKFGVRADGTLYANNAVISGTITVGSGSTIDSETTVGGTSLSNIAQNASTGAQAASDLSAFETAVSNTYATQEALSDVEEQIPDVSGLAEKNNVVYRIQRIYYRKTTFGAPNKNETWLATSGTGYGNWSLNIPQLTHTENNVDVKYPYLYTAVQTQTVTQYNGGNGTACSCTNVLLDDTATVIDGGSIIAGSVTANEITGSTLSAIYADLGAITAGSISRGNNSINFNQDAATLEFKNASTWTNATRGIQWTGSDLNIKGNITATSLTLNSGVTVPAGNVSGLSTVATTGTYSSLTGTPDLAVYVAKDGTIGTEPSDSSASTSTGFKVSSEGLLKAANAVITGKIFASSGTIGGWNIGTDTNKSLYYDNQTPGATTTNLVLSPTSATNSNAIGGSGIGLTWFISAGKTFGVTTAGKLYATGANISGSIEATSFIAKYSGGTIGAQLTATGLEVFDENTDSVGKFGSSIRLGSLNGLNMRFTPGSTSGSTTAGYITIYYENNTAGYIYGRNDDGTRNIRIGANTYSADNDNYSISLGPDGIFLNYSPNYYLSIDNTDGANLYGGLSIVTGGLEVIGGATELSNALTVNSSITASASIITGAHVRPNNNGTSTNNYCGTSDYAWNGVYTRAITLVGAADGTTNITGAVTTSSSIRSGASFIARAHVRPDNNLSTSGNTNYCGTTDARWNGIYSKAAVDVSSDRKLKNITGSIDFAKELIMNLQPVDFKFIESDQRRKHMGLIAQDAAQTCKEIGEDLSFVAANYITENCEEEIKYYGEDVDDELLTWGIKYEELIAPIIKVVQSQQQEIESLKQRIELLEESN